MQENTMAELTRRAEASLASGHIEEARDQYAQLSELDAKNEETWLMLAAIHGELDNLSEALLCADRAISIDPTYVEAYLTKANLLQRLDRFEDAMESALEAVRSDAEYGEAWLFLGGLAGRL
jgi:tetratricopeptide (TPR) repeat protein